MIWETFTTTIWMFIIGFLCATPLLFFCAVLGIYFRLGRVVTLLKWQQEQIRKRQRRR